MTKISNKPTDWDIKEVRDLAKVKGGKRLPLGKSVTDRITPHPYIRVTDMVPGGIESSNIKYVPDDAFEAIKNYRISKDDIFISVAGTLGIVGKIPPHLDGANLTENADKVTDISCDRDFLLYHLLSERIQSQIEAEKTVGAQPKLALGKIEKFLIPLPPTVEEQRAIASALSDMDALLAKLDQLIAKKRDIKQAAMQELLTGRRRLSGHSTTWTAGTLRDVIADLEAGVSVNSVDHENPGSTGQPCILKTSAIYDGEFNPSECKLIDTQDAGRARLSPRKDTILVSRMNTPNLVGEVGYVANDYPNLYLPDRLWMTRFHQGAKVCPRWLAYMLSSTHIKDKIKGLATGTSGSMKNISKGALLGMEMAFPVLEEQIAIAMILSDMDAEITALETRREKTNLIKQGMMQALLTGRVRLV